MDDQEFLEYGLSSLAFEEDSGDERSLEVQFDPKQCLFCNLNSNGLKENIEHMLKGHGLLIPDISRLIVDSGTLIEYFHLVIYGYYECLFCGSQRSSVKAAKQHMIGKGHCKINIEREDSEFRDFYEFDSDAQTSDGGDDNVVSKKRSDKTFVKIDDNLRLPSGKLLSHRSQGNWASKSKSRELRSQKESAIEKQAATLDNFEHEPEENFRSSKRPESSKRVAKRETAFNNQLASLRADDRRSLMHLPVSQQRALVMKSKRQVEQARRDANEMQLKIQLRANKSLKG